MARSLVLAVCAAYQITLLRNAEAVESSLQLFSESPYVEEVSQPVDFLNEVSALFADESFSQNPLRVRNSNNSDDQHVFVMFYAHWCPHCHTAAPLWHDTAAAYHCAESLEFWGFECSNAKGRSQEREVLLANMSQPWPVWIADLLKSNARVIPADVCHHFTVEGYPTFVHLTAPTATDAAATILGWPRVTLSKPNLGSYSLHSLRSWVRNETGVNFETINCPHNQKADSASEETARPTTAVTRKSQAEILTLRGAPRWDSSRLKNQMTDTRLHDAYAGLGTLLRNWVNAEAVMNNEKRTHLLQLIRVCISYLPGIKQKVALMTLYDNLKEKQYYANDEALAVRDWNEWLDSVDFGGIRVPPVGFLPLWKHVNSASGALWLLFHYLSLGLLESASLTPAHPFEPLTAGALIATVYDTVNDFFGCRVCQKHFEDSVRRCYADLCDWVSLNSRDFGGISFTAKQNSAHQASTEVGKKKLALTEEEGAALWLWRMHNAVTFRTAVETTSANVIAYLQAKQLPLSNTVDISGYKTSRSSGGNILQTFAGQDVRFPTIEECRRCRLTKRASEVESDWPTQHTVSYSHVVQAARRAGLRKGFAIYEKSQDSGVTRDYVEQPNRSAQRISGPEGGHKIDSESAILLRETVDPTAEAEYSRYTRQNAALPGDEDTVADSHTRGDSGGVEKSHSLTLSWLTNLELRRTDVSDESEEEISDETYDVLDDFDLVETLKFLKSYYWGENYSRQFDQFMWNENTGTFDYSRLILPEASELQENLARANGSLEGAIDMRKRVILKALSEARTRYHPPKTKMAIAAAGLFLGSTFLVLYRVCTKFSTRSSNSSSSTSTPTTVVVRPSSSVLGSRGEPRYHPTDETDGYKSTTKVNRTALLETVLGKRE